jgi:hypothetical protein
VIKNKAEIVVKDADGVEVKYTAVRPSQSVRAEADIVRSAAWGKYSLRDVPVSAKLKDIVAKQGLWGDDKQKELDALDERMNRLEAMVPDDKGKVKAKGVTLEKARAAAFELRAARAERVDLLSPITRLSGHTAESLADSDAFEFVLTRCLLDPATEKPAFPSVEEYKRRADDAEVAAAAGKFAEFYYGHDPDFEKRLPENRFLVARGFVDPETLVPKRAKADDPVEESYDLEDEPAEPAAPPPDTDRLA